MANVTQALCATGNICLTLCSAYGLPIEMDYMLGGTITSGNFVDPVRYPSWGIAQANVDKGVSMLDTAINTHWDAINAVQNSTQNIIVFGYGLGAVVATQWLATNASGCDVPDDRLSFILIGNIVNPYGGFCAMLDLYPTARLPQDGSTGYQVTNFTRQYDGWADFPANIFKFVTLWNTLSGQSAVHTSYENVKLSDAGNVSYTVGQIKYIWSMTQPIPCLGTWWDILSAEIDQWFRPIIESCYMVYNWTTHTSSPQRPVTIPSPDYAAILPSSAFQPTSSVEAPSMSALMGMLGKQKTLNPDKVVGPWGPKRGAFHREKQLPMGGMKRLNRGR